MRFVCSLWDGAGFWKRTARYGADDVVKLASALRRHGGHDLTCMTDGAFELPSSIDQIHMPECVASLPDYLPKLYLWSPDLQQIIGERYACIDLAVVVLDDIEPVLSVPYEPVILWDEAVGEPYNTSLFAVEPGHGTQVWLHFTPDRLSAARAAATRWTGDQSWVAHVLGGRRPTFGERDGILRYRGGRHIHGVPDGTRAVFFCGPISPATEIREAGWIAENWR
jgi:hypothetical protein